MEVISDDQDFLHYETDAVYAELVDLLDDIASPGWIKWNLEDGLTKDEIIAKAQRGEERSREWMKEGTMKITKSRLKQIIKEEKAKLLNEFRIPRGFIRISKPSDVNFLLKQERDGTIGPMQWNINNGVIVIIPETGARHASVYVTERAGGREDARRTTPEAEARASLDAEGYKRNTNIYVPLSNPGFEN